MKFAMTKIAAAMVLAGASAGAAAAPETIIDLNVTSGSFFMMFFTPAPINFGPIGFDMVDGYGSQANLFPFGPNPVSVFTGDGTMAPFGGAPVVGGPVPSGTVDADAGTISLDLSAFTAYWNGTNFNQGSSTVTGTYNGGTGAFSVSWSSLINGGPFDGNTGDWTMQGVAAVPEASTYGMMLAGLGLVGFAVRRRKLMA